jgi:hypothetical protein
MRFLDDIPPARPSSSRLPADPVLRLARARHDCPPARPPRFKLTRAVRPGWQGGVDPTEGYRLDTYVDQRNGFRLPAVIASVSAERLFDVFVSLMEQLGQTCDVVLESSHEADYGRHRDHVREGVERTVLESTLWEFEELLLDDGCTGIAVMHPDRPVEVQLDEHKLLVVYAEELGPFEEILRDHGVPARPGIRFITQGEHLHASHARFQARFEELCGRLGAA